jgi:hypothetical protein
MAHTCNPSYAGGRDQEDHSLKPARAIVRETLSKKKKITKRGWWALSSNLSTAKKKKGKKGASYLIQAITMLLYWFAFKTNLKQSPVASSPF